MLWKESLRDPEKWVGEVSEIIYNPYRDELLLARADGHYNLGVYVLDRKTGKAKKILDKPALKGSLHLEYACLAVHRYPHGFEGIECVDLIGDKHIIIEKPELTVIDSKKNIPDPLVGPVASLEGRLLVFVRGGAIVSDPINNEHYFVRLFDIPCTQYSPLRVNAIPYGGGIVTAYNAYVHDIIHYSEKPITKNIYIPTMLLYVVLPIIQILGVFGARITSIEFVGDKLLLATNTIANTDRYDASPYD